MSESREPDQREIIGYSIRGKARRERWIAGVRGIAALVKENGWQHEVVFHGTSEKHLPFIASQGVRPTDAGLATEGHALGSFWGDVDTAAAYAEDTVKHRGGNRPVLLAARTADLLDRCEALVPDLSTLDFPLKGLTRLDDAHVYARWVDGHGYRSLGWRDALDDLSALVAVHGEPISPDAFAVVDSPEAVTSLLERTFRASP
jgi:hypothetical protein